MLLKLIAYLQPTVLMGLLPDRCNFYTLALVVIYSMQIESSARL